MVRPIGYAPPCQSSEEIVVRAGHEVMMEVDGNISMNVVNPQGIFDQHLRPRQVHSLTITIIIFNNKIK